MNIKVNNFQDLGSDYQLQLFNEIITDDKFGLSIIDVIDPKYFPSESFAKIAFIIKSYYEKHNCLLNFPALRTEIQINVPSTADVFKAQLLDTLDIIEKCKIGNLNVQETAQRFCKLQSMKNAVNQIKTKLDKGILDEIDNIEETLRKAITFREIDDPVDVDEGIDEALSDEHREIIPTGINGLEDVLAKKELGLIIAPTGIGKSTMMTKIANTAYRAGYNVLQIFFEDKRKAIQRKHITATTGVHLSELQAKREEVKRKLEAAKTGAAGKNYLYKVNDENFTTKKIRNIIKRFKSKGIIIDLVIVDYLECMSFEGGATNVEDWTYEGKIMRQLESLADEMNLGVWAATQGNKGSNDLQIVTLKDMGGSNKKAAVAHVIISIAKTLQQKEEKRATITLIKFREGDDGIIFENCLFDNGRMEIDTHDKITVNGFEEKNKRERNDKAIQKLREIQKKRENSDDDDITEK